jgi:ubiquinone biosynthesis accessory factor UbiJ
MSGLKIPSIVLSAINHLIEQEKWAYDLLLHHDGKIVSIDLPIGQYRILIQEGLLKEASTVESPSSVTLQISQEAIWAFVREGKSAAMKYIRISGDVDLAADLNRLFAELKWEAEEDLSKIIGDAASRRLVLETKKVFNQANQAMQDLKIGVRDYFVHEKSVLVGTNHLRDFKSELRVVRDQLDRAEKRLSMIEQRIKTKEAQ